jgi:RNA polymerase sigma factor (sigma-70 family)
MSDMDLVRQYVDEASEEAFTALVMRHLNFVYSSARRQVGSEETARDVSQVVFLDLSLNAKKLRPDTHLVSWLHVVTRRTSIDAIRRESRRRRREEIAVEIAAMKTTASSWEHIEPWLDESVASLDAADRKAVLLRYFEDRSLRDIGLALGISEDAAQKRLSRAVERLRELLQKRGVAVSAAGIASDISENAVHPAPEGFGAAISSAVALSQTALHKAAVLHIAKDVTMTTTQKTLIVVTLAAALGGGIYQETSIHSQARQISAFERQSANSEEQMRTLRTLRDAALARSPTSRQGDAGAASTNAPSARSKSASMIDSGERLRILEDLQKRKILNSHMTFIDPTGGLSPAFVEIFTLTGEEQKTLQGAVDQARQQMGDLMVANATVHSNGDNNVVINIKALDGGPAVGDNVMNAIANTLGPDRFSSFLALGASQLQEALGNFGAQEETISITSNTSSSGQGEAAGYIVQDTRNLANNTSFSNSSNFPNIEAILARWPIAPLLPKKF